MVGNLFPRFVRRGFELLQPDQAGKVSVHIEQGSLCARRAGQKKSPAGGFADFAVSGK
jgi:hypothetical protein